MWREGVTCRLYNHGIVYTEHKYLTLQTIAMNIFFPQTCSRVYHSIILYLTNISPLRQSVAGPPTLHIFDSPCLPL